MEAEQEKDGKLSGSEGDENAEGESVFFDESAANALADQERKKQEIEKRKAARALIVPTADADVKAGLRARGEPICLFGEDTHDRRERLRALLAAEADAGVTVVAPEVEEAKEEEEEKPPEEFFTEGSEELKAFRLETLDRSIANAKERLQESRKRQRSVEFREEGNEICLSVQKIELVSSQIGDSRPLSACAFGNAGALNGSSPSIVATGSWAGKIKLWDMKTMQLHRSLSGHTERISSLTFDPKTPTMLASSGADRTVRIWNLSSEAGKEEQLVLQGHADRVAGIAFHPHSKVLASGSFDTTWRLWDLETGRELLLQEGHSKAVYRVAFHPDGSLAASAGLDRATRVWDMRSGRCIMTFQGHVDSVLGLDFSPDGSQLATGSGDNSIRIWDLRRRKCFTTIPAHLSCVTNVKFQPNAGHVLLSTSFDRTAKLWSTRGYVLVKALTTHEEKITCGDITSTGDYIATSCYDKTWKLWSTKEGF